MSDEALCAEATLESYRRAIASVAAASGDIRAAALCLAAVWRAGGRLIYAGAGPSGLAAAGDAAELPGTFGLDATCIAIVLSGGTAEPFRIDAEDDAAAGEQAMVELGDLTRDAVITLSASGSTSFTVAAAAEARGRGALVIAIALRPGEPLLAGAD